MHPQFANGAWHRLHQAHGINATRAAYAALGSMELTRSVQVLGDVERIVGSGLGENPYACGCSVCGPHRGSGLEEWMGAEGQEGIGLLLRRFGDYAGGVRHTPERLRMRQGRCWCLKLFDGVPIAADVGIDELVGTLTNRIAQRLAGGDGVIEVNTGP